jgi:hypothetical protein
MRKRYEGKRNARNGGERKRKAKKQEKREREMKMRD